MGNKYALISFNFSQICFLFFFAFFSKTHHSKPISHSCIHSKEECLYTSTKVRQKIEEFLLEGNSSTFFFFFVKFPALSFSMYWFHVCSITLLPFNFPYLISPAFPNGIRFCQLKQNQMFFIK